MNEVADADRIIAALALEPHPEGGHYRETWRDQTTDGRGSGSAIYYLLKQGEKSAWHRIDAAEIWHYYGGAALELYLREGDEDSRFVLGRDIDAGERPQIIVPAGAWQTAKSLGPWTLVGCTVSPAFEFAGFELAPGAPPGS
ncbi:MAG: cupin domain-containing protein [Alphaproteobacteria bacterium]|nr:cupin domain-containing protein [Alphaproteobacteria bacterium]